MSAKDLTPGANGKIQVARVLLGEAEATSAASDVYETATAETVALFNVPINTLVLNVHARVINAFRASCTIGIGDGDGTSGWLATAKIAPTSAITTGIYVHTDKSTVDTYGGGKLYAAADTIDALIGAGTWAATDDGQLDVIVEYITLGELKDGIAA